MTQRMTALKAKYRNRLNSQHPKGIVDEPSWRVFVAAMRDGTTLRDLSRQTGLSTFRITQIILRVDRELDPPAVPDGGKHVTLDSYIEDLHLSTRARNALRQMGCDTVRAILEKDFSRAVRFGPGTRQEVVQALITHGFAPPAALNSQQATVEALARDVSKLRETIEQRYRSSLDHLVRLEDSIRKLSEGSGRQYVDE